jgi:hypothetical protein
MLFDTLGCQSLPRLAREIVGNCYIVFKCRIVYGGATNHLCQCHDFRVTPVNPTVGKLAVQVKRQLDLFFCPKSGCHDVFRRNYGGCRIGRIFRKDEPSV